MIFIAFLTTETAVATLDGTTSRVALRASVVKVINLTPLASIVVTYVTHALVLQFWIHCAIHGFRTHNLDACGDITHHVSKPHFIITNVITAIRNITIMAPIPTMIFVDQESITLFDGALKTVQIK
jgi:hypothetical protein